MTFRPGGRNWLDMLREWYWNNRFREQWDPSKYAYVEDPYRPPNPAGYGQPYGYQQGPASYMGAQNPNLMPPGYTQPGQQPGAYNPNAYDVRSQGQPGTVGVQQDYPGGPGSYWNPDYSRYRQAITNLNNAVDPAAGWYTLDPNTPNTQTYAGGLIDAQNTGLSNAMYYSPYYGGIGGPASGGRKRGDSMAYARGSGPARYTPESIQEQLNSINKSLQEYKVKGKKNGLSYTRARSIGRLGKMKTRRNKLKGIQDKIGAPSGYGLDTAASGGMAQWG